MWKWIRLAFECVPTILAATGKEKEFVKHPEKYSIQERFDYAQKLLTKVNDKGFHAVYYVQGKENLPEGQLFFVGNHTSNLDPVSMINISDRPVSFLAKDSVKKMIVVGDILTSIGGKFIDRGDVRSQLKVLKETDIMLKEHPELSFMVYPEGTRAWGPEFALGEFKPGAFKIAVKRNLPVVPVCMYLNDRILNQSFHYHKYPVQITYCKPIMPEEYENMTTQEISDIAKSRIQEALDQMKAKDRELVKTLNGYSDKKTDKVLVGKHKKRY